MILHIHQGFLVLGGMAILSTLVFRELKRGDGGSVTRQKAALPVG
jgi:hypothetical protein